MQDEPVGLFRLMRNYLKIQHIQARSPMDVMISLFEARVEYLADTLEDLNGKVRLNLLDTQRSLRYLMRSCNRQLTDHQKDSIREMLRDIESLTPHTGFLFEKINFLMESTMGYINLEQNNIIEIFSVAAVMFLPPTLIASIYGMNFKVMPELNTRFGYPLALGLMLTSALGTYLFFKRKDWL